MKPFRLQRPRSSLGADPEFLELTVHPELGMNLSQIRAFLPGSGEMDVLAKPSLEQAQEPGSSRTLAPFQWGGAVLAPFANRIRGNLSQDSGTITTRVLDRLATLPANWSGNRPGAERCSMHGLILNAKMDAVESSGDSVTAAYDAGDFGGHWLSTTVLTFRINLHPARVEFFVSARNTGQESSPIGIGWHPYFALPSRKREQARMRLPARQRVLVNNYDDVFPTGKLAQLAGTDYDFAAAAGRQLGAQYLDDCFVDLERGDGGHTVMEITDPAAHYGLRLTALSPEVKALQVYAPPDETFIALEPQFNWADPFSEIWPPGIDTGMVWLAPGQWVRWGVRCELFVVN